MTYFEAYLLTRLDGFNNLFLVFAIISLITLIVCGLGTLISFVEDEEEINKKFRSFAKFSAITFTIILTVKSLIPTTKEAAFIYIAPAIVNNQDIQKTIKKLPELSGLGLEYLGEILKEEIKETKKEVKESIK